AVGWAAWHQGRPGVTGKLEVRYRLPLQVGERVRVTGRVDSVRRNLVYASATIERVSDGAKVAEANATLMDAVPTVAGRAPGHVECLGFRRGLAQSGSALGSGPRGPGFESRAPDQFVRPRSFRPAWPVVDQEEGHGRGRE